MVLIPESLYVIYQRKNAASLMCRFSALSYEHYFIQEKIFCSVSISWCRLIDSTHTHLSDWGCSILFHLISLFFSAGLIDFFSVSPSSLVLHSSLALSLYPSLSYPEGFSLLNVIALCTPPPPFFFTDSVCDMKNWFLPCGLTCRLTEFLQDFLVSY